MWCLLIGLPCLLWIVHNKHLSSAGGSEVFLKPEMLTELQMCVLNMHFLTASSLWFQKEVKFHISL